MKLKELHSLMQASSHEWNGWPTPPLVAVSIDRMLRSQDIQPFAKPKVELEQYPTGCHLASRMLFTVRPLHACVHPMRQHVPHPCSNPAD
jgi:hypothetical protein